MFPNFIRRFMREAHMRHPEREFKVRVSMFPDIPHLVDIERSQFEGLGWDGDQIQAFLAKNPHRHTIVCADKATDMPIAHAVCRLTKHVCLVERLVTHRQYQRLGAGSLLMKRACEAAAHGEGRQLETVVPDAWLPAAGHFMKALQFGMVQRLPLYDGWQDYYRFRYAQQPASVVPPAAAAMI